MLVGTASQYGVSSIYLLAAWFQVAPIGYGTLGLLTGSLTALWFGAGYGVLRLAGTSRLLSASAFGVAVVALVFNLVYPVGSLPQSGPLRFGMPMLLVLVAVAGERFPRRARAARVAAAAIVGLSSVWSLEAFAYTAFVFAAVACVQAWLSPEPGRLRALARRGAGRGARVRGRPRAVRRARRSPPPAGCRTGASTSPTCGSSSSASIGDLTYDVPRWTPGLAVGAGYLASAAALVELARRRGPLVERERPALIALAGVTAYGIALMSYYVDRSLDHILIYVALPALLAGALWLGLLLRCGAAVGRAAQTAGLAFSLAVAVLVVAVAWSSIDARFPRSALAHAAPGGELAARGARAPLAPAAARARRPGRPAGAGALHAGRAGEPRDGRARPRHRDPAPQRPRGQAAPRRPVGGELRRGGGAAGPPGRGRRAAPGRPDAPGPAGPAGARHAAGDPSRDALARPAPARSRRCSSGRCSGSTGGSGCGASPRRPGGLHGRGAAPALSGQARRAST